MFDIIATKVVVDVNRVVFRKKLTMTVFVLLLIILKMASKNQVLDEARKSIEKKFGKGALIRMGDSSNVGLVTTFHS